MPELPEVEVTRIGLQPFMVGQTIRDIECRVPRLRHEVPEQLLGLKGRTVRSVLRRGKYLLFNFCDERVALSGWLIVHLGMSGSLRVVPFGAERLPHDHIDFVMDAGVIRYRDPRRFGTVQWHQGEDVQNHPLLLRLGLEPLDERFCGAWLFETIQGRSLAIKALVMDAQCIVGVGNIYAAESLFRAKIHPERPAGSLSQSECGALALSIKNVLNESICAGGSSVRDYVQSDGGAGSFQLSCKVYGRKGQDCVVCRSVIQSVKIGGRSSFFCPVCQK